MFKRKYSPSISVAVPRSVPIMIILHPIRKLFESASFTVPDNFPVVPARDILTNNKDIITYARLGMIALAIAGLLIANLPGMQLVWLFLFFAVLRAAVWLPSMISLLKPEWVTEPGMFWGIILAAVPGEALFVWGKMFGGGSYIVFTGTLVAILGAPILTLIISHPNVKYIDSAYKEK